jgi:hypothetical protein
MPIQLRKPLFWTSLAVESHLTVAKLLPSGVASAGQQKGSGSGSLFRAPAPLRGSPNESFLITSLLGGLFDSASTICCWMEGTYQHIKWLGG